jgi:hypothetical protein
MLRDDPACINLAVYFGHNVVQATHEIAVADTVIQNSLFGKTYAEIDALFASDPEKPVDLDLSYESLRERTGRILWRGTPRIEQQDGSGSSG